MNNYRLDYFVVLLNFQLFLHPATHPVAKLLSSLEQAF